MIPISVYSALRDDSGVSAIINGRVYPNVAAQSAGLPYIVYSVSSEEEENSISGASGLSKVNFFVNCYSKTYKQSKDMADAVRIALESVGCVLVDEQDRFDDESRAFVAECEFFVWSRNL